MHNCSVEKMKLPKCNLDHLLYTHWILADVSKSFPNESDGDTLAFICLNNEQSFKLAHGLGLELHGHVDVVLGSAEKKGCQLGIRAHRAPLSHDAWWRVSLVKETGAARLGAWCRICRSRRQPSPGRLKGVRASGRPMAATNFTGAGRFAPKFLGNLPRVSLKIYDRILLEARTSIMLAGLFLLTKRGSKSFKNTSLLLRGTRCRPFPQPI